MSIYIHFNRHKWRTNAYNGKNKAIKIVLKQYWANWSFWHDNEWVSKHSSFGALCLAKERLLCCFDPAVLRFNGVVGVFHPSFLHGREAGEVLQRQYCCVDPSHIQQGEAFFFCFSRCCLSSAVWSGVMCSQPSCSGIGWHIPVVIEHKLHGWGHGRMTDRGKGAF